MEEEWNSDLENELVETSIRAERDIRARQMENEEYPEDLVNNFMRAYDEEEEIHAPGEVNSPEQDNQAVRNSTLDQYYSITGPHRTFSSRRFRTDSQCCWVRFNEEHGIPDAEAVANSAVGAAVDRLVGDTQQDDLVGAEIFHPALDTPILINFGNKEGLTDRILSRIATVQQSKRDLGFDNSLRINVVRVHPPTGMGRNRKLLDITLRELFLNHSGHGSSFIMIENKDWKCMARAIIVAKAKIEESEEILTKEQYKAIANCNRPLQGRKADELIRMAGIREADCKIRGCGLNEAKAFQTVLAANGYALKIFSHSAHNDIIYDGGLGTEKYIYLFHYDDHYCVIKSPKIFTGHNYFCNLCNKGYNTIQRHKCAKRCPGCKFPGKCTADDGPAIVDCQDCARFFYSQQCFANHLKPENELRHDTGRPPAKKHRLSVTNLCQKLKKCKQCMVSWPIYKLDPRKHNCGERQCGVCKVWEKNGVEHKCYVQPYKVKSKIEKHKKKRTGQKVDQKRRASQRDPASEEETEDSDEHDEENWMHNDGDGRPERNEAGFWYLFFDFECTQETVVGEDAQGLILEHIPTLAICKKVCSMCKEHVLEPCPINRCTHRNCEHCKKKIPARCKCEGDYYRVFKGRDCRDKFCEFLFQKKHKGITAIAHNGKGSFFTLI